MNQKNTVYQLQWLTDNLAVGQAPMSYEALDSLREQGISAILNLCAEYCDLHWIEADAGFEVYYFPIPDEEAPDLQELEKALDWLDECLFLGKKVLVHCRYGLGRTGTVVNAYLLRKGLGHKLAGKKLKGVKAKPANFDQWWFIRKYGKKEKPLTIREPSLESKQLVDLFPYFTALEEIWEEVDRDLEAAGSQDLCGRDHSRCCREPVPLTFIEAVYLHHIMNAHLGRRDRQQIIDRAVAALRVVKEVEATAAVGRDGFLAAYRAADLLCPMNAYEECLVFPCRPLLCRLFDLSASAAFDMRQRVEAQLLTLSQEVFAAFAGSDRLVTPPRFLLPEVVSGRFVQRFFQQLTARAAAAEPAPPQAG
ncbi:MAG: protein-tyrosine phosphatase family protein [Desulfobacca sp.]|uniref:protein-tyrosine phosphatase family protein n=1 Tax=Desulfobacca sp. TaxID=2067990 RepID=UPI004049B95E